MLPTRLAIQWRLLKGRTKYLRKAVKAVSGGDPGLCNLCGYQGRFINFGTPMLIGVRCPQCYAGPRHRLLKLVQDRERIIPSGLDVLHFAAERSAPCLMKAISPRRHVTADLSSGFDLQVNIENLAIDDASFDVVICSHVLEHVNDRPALANIHRVLRPKGILVAMVPIVEGWDQTYENPAITCRRERKRHFDGATHVRFYGRDFRNRLRDAGFTVSEYTSCAPEDVLKHRLLRGERIFVGVRS